MRRSSARGVAQRAFADTREARQAIVVGGRTATSVTEQEAAADSACFFAVA
jgi:hypothetical protein